MFFDYINRNIFKINLGIGIWTSQDSERENIFPTFGLNRNMKFTVFLLDQTSKPAPKYMIFPNQFGDLPGIGRFLRFRMNER